MVVQERLYTAKDLEKLPDDGNRYELNRGELIVMPPAKKEHGLVVSQANRLLGNHVVEKDLGEVVAEIGYLLERDPDTVRAPDISFISKARMAPLTVEYEAIGFCRKKGSGRVRWAKLPQNRIEGQFNNPTSQSL